MPAVSRSNYATPGTGLAGVGQREKFQGRPPEPRPLRVRCLRTSGMHTRPLCSLFRGIHEREKSHA